MYLEALYSIDRPLSLETSIEYRSVSAVSPIKQEWELLIGEDNVVLLIYGGEDT